ncbi:NUDIX hydrolase [Arboricoccus pini]|nr:NUDIX domain-containing protein [Arboricoccus pini]
MIRIAVALLLRPDGLALLVRKRGSRIFIQPGGKIEPGERPEAALRRELHEELGLAIEPSALVPLGQGQADAANEPGHRVLADMFGLISATAPRIGAEIETDLWIDPLQPPDEIEIAPLSRHVVLPQARLLRLAAP